MEIRRSLHRIIGTMAHLLSSMACGTRAPTAVQTGQHAHAFEERGLRLNYLLFVPRGYGKQPQGKWPLILFLHGAGERGDGLEDLELVKVHGLPMLVERQVDFPFVVLSPQCPTDSYWDFQLDGLEALLDGIVATYAVDTDRIYLTGLSMGGFGTWHLALRHPGRFAAIAPIAGGYRFESDSVPENICDLKDTPVWAFHGARDTVVPPSRSQVMVDALRACDGDVRFTLYPDVEHDSWTETYNNPELYAWLLQHTR